MFVDISFKSLVGGKSNDKQLNVKKLKAICYLQISRPFSAILNTLFCTKCLMYQIINVFNLERFRFHSSDVIGVQAWN